MSLANPAVGATRPRSRTRRVLVGLVKWGSLTVVTVLLVCAIAARVLHARDEARWKAPGRLVDVGGGRKVHLYCTGAGEPTVVLDAGLGNFSVDAWANVQPAVSQVTRVCSYDRAGSGWSDPPPTPQMPNATVSELRSVLTSSGERPPYVMVGHSYGGLLVRHYAIRYPGEAAGLVIVDGTHEDQLERMPPPPSWFPYLIAGIGAANWLGIDRVAAGTSANDSVAAIATARNTRPQAMRSVLALFDSLGAMLDQVGRNPRTLGDLPLVVLARGVVSAEPGQSPEQAARAHKTWLELQREVAGRSTQGELIVAEKSGHFIQSTQPDLVIAKVTEMVRGVRASASAALP